MKTQFILAAVLSLATVSAMADSHHKHHKPYRGEKVTVIHHQAPRHHVAPPRHAPQPQVRHHQRPVETRYVQPVVVAPPPAPRVVHHAPPRPVVARPTANFSLSVNL